MNLGLLFDGGEGELKVRGKVGGYRDLIDVFVAEESPLSQSEGASLMRLRYGSATTAAGGLFFIIAAAAAAFVMLA